MGAPPDSQAAPLPTQLPFRLVSKTIGAGAYASIRKAVPLGKSSPIIAIKFIHKQHAQSHGKLSPKQIKYEVSYHQTVCSGGTPHPNIIRILDHGEDPVWHWLALELAEGGDLFDKIEADEGVSQEVAHFYFKQLMGAVAWCHSRGIAHRDIKPENMLLSGEGDLKLADFGLATMYMDMRDKRTKMSNTVCGSPPYIAPEIVQVGLANLHRKRNPDAELPKAGYEPNVADIWSCAIVLFVLLVGNTPWDTPVVDQSAEFADYVDTSGRPNDELWDGIPMETLSLIRGMLRIDPKERFTMNQIKVHPWYAQRNRYMSDKGTSTDSVALATTMMERLRIDMSQAPATRRTGTVTQNGHDSQPAAWEQCFPQTQPETPATDAPFDWEPTRVASQPLTAADLTSASALADAARALADTDVALSQFSASQGLPLTLTQAARRFADIAPGHGLTRFYSPAPRAELVATLQAALAGCGVVAKARRGHGGAEALFVQGVDGRRQPISGNVEFAGTGLVEVRFTKAKGDPVEWRRLFKEVVGKVRHVVFVPGERL